MGNTDGALGANTLLAYFHYCNKGIYPFSAECRDADLRSLAELDDDAIELVRYTRKYVAEHSKYFHRLPSVSWNQQLTPGV